MRVLNTGCTPVLYISLYPYIYLEYKLYQILNSVLAAMVY